MRLPDLLQPFCKSNLSNIIAAGYLDNRRLAVTALGKGGQFLYSEREESGRTSVLLLELEAEPCIFDSRGHAVAHYQQSAIPATPLRGFDSQFGEPHSINCGNHFYHGRIGRSRLSFDPKGVLEQAAALQVKPNGVVRRQSTKGGGLMATMLEQHSLSVLGLSQYWGGME